MRLLVVATGLLVACSGTQVQTRASRAPEVQDDAQPTDPLGRIDMADADELVFIDSVGMLPYTLAGRFSDGLRTSFGHPVDPLEIHLANETELDALLAESGNLAVDSPEVARQLFEAGRYAMLGRALRARGDRVRAESFEHAFSEFAEEVIHMARVVEVLPSGALEGLLRTDDRRGVRLLERLFEDAFPSAQFQFLRALIHSDTPRARAAVERIFVSLDRRDAWTRGTTILTRQALSRGVTTRTLASIKARFSAILAEEDYPERDEERLAQGLVSAGQLPFVFQHWAGLPERVRQQLLDSVDPQTPLVTFAPALQDETTLSTTGPVLLCDAFLLRARPDPQGMLASPEDRRAQREELTGPMSSPREWQRHASPSLLIRWTSPMTVDPGVQSEVTPESLRALLARIVRGHPTPGILRAVVSREHGRWRVELALQPRLDVQITPGIVVESYIHGRADTSVSRMGFHHPEHAAFSRAAALENLTPFFDALRPGETLALNLRW